MDFKGDFPIGHRRCYPLTVLDDHSRFALAVQACLDQRRTTVERALRQIFERYGLPAEMLMDNGSPWGKRHELTALALWLMGLGIRIIHGRSRHPQTHGKDERFHRTRKLEGLRHCQFVTLPQCQREFDRFRDCYHLVRPHQAIDLQVPASRYQPSPIAFPDPLPPIEYSADTIVRRVQAEGWFSFRGQHFRVIGKTKIIVGAEINDWPRLPTVVNNRARICGGEKLWLIQFNRPRAETHPVCKARWSLQRVVAFARKEITQTKLCRVVIHWTVHCLTVALLSRNGLSQQN